ncbi:MAG TPA: inorganic diphosphatase [Verrucomicrobiae bacterium]|jgi:inorganic pyrophosphatase|nr:inorganic diphosphatase [Verrucomicrobiae bacterium]
MKTMIEKLKPYAEKNKCVNVIVETPKGSRVKYAYDPETGFFILSKALPEGMMFPFNFGFVPNTLAEDGDPLDILVLNEEPLISGCLLKVQPIAIIKATQTEDDGEVRNDRIIGQALSKETPLEFQEESFDKRMASQIGFFFTSYNKLYGKKFKILGIGGKHKAFEMIDRSIKRFRDKKGSE